MITLHLTRDQAIALYEHLDRKLHHEFMDFRERDPDLVEVRNKLDDWLRAIGEIQ